MSSQGSKLPVQRLGLSMGWLCPRGLCGPFQVRLLVVGLRRRVGPQPPELQLPLPLGGCLGAVGLDAAPLSRGGRVLGSALCAVVSGVPRGERTLLCGPSAPPP